jgi:protein SCO1/2
MSTAQSRGIQRTVIVVIAAIIVMVLGFIWRINQPIVMHDRELRANGAIMFETPRTFSEVELIDHLGAEFTDSDLEGVWTIAFFGFTNCPDICPATMSILGDMYSKLRDRERERIQVVMVSLDPARDSVELLRDYVPYFNADFIGVTGSEPRIKRWSAELNIAYGQVPLGDNDYTIDHSTQLVLINPRGDYHGFFKAPHNEMMLRKTWRSIDATFDAWPE